MRFIGCLAIAPSLVPCRPAQLSFLKRHVLYLLGARPADRWQALWLS